jgi:hypothetical protein
MGGDPGSIALRAGEGLRALERNGSSGSSRDGDSGMAGCDCGGDLPERGDARYDDGGVPTWKRSDDCIDESESRLPPACCAPSCSVFPSSALILCLTRAVNESDRDGSFCRQRSTNMALLSRGDSSSWLNGCGSGNRGTAGIRGMAGAAAPLGGACSKPWNPVCVREMGFGLKSSSSSCIAGSTLEILRANTGETLSESCEYSDA